MALVELGGMPGVRSAHGFISPVGSKQEREKDRKRGRAKEERLENKAIKCCFVNSFKTNGKHRSPSSTTTILKDRRVSKHGR